MQAASRQLAKTERGRAVMQQLVQLLDSNVLDLDLLDQRALLALLGGVWSGQAVTAREVVRTTLAQGARSD